MNIHFLTLFPEMYTGVLGSSILARAKEKAIVDYNLINFRDYSGNKHNKVDDYPYGGGAGMVLKPEPIFNAMDALELSKDARVILLCPQGAPFNQKKAERRRHHRRHHRYFAIGNRRLGRARGSRRVHRRVPCRPARLRMAFGGASRPACSAFGISAHLPDGSVYCDHGARFVYVPGHVPPRPVRYAERARLGVPCVHGDHLPADRPGDGACDHRQILAL